MDEYSWGTLVFVFFFFVFFLLSSCCESMPTHLWSLSGLKRAVVEKLGSLQRCFAAYGLFFSFFSCDVYCECRDDLGFSVFLLFIVAVVLKVVYNSGIVYV